VSNLAGPVPLNKDHECQGFDCGKEALNQFIEKHALANQSNNSARTFVALDGNKVAGYYSLAASAIVHEDAPARLAKGLARHPIPIVLMARFAVDRRYQGKGLGSALFKDAIKRTLNVSKDLGARAFVVHAKDDDAKRLYEHFNMEPFEGNPFHLYLLMKDIETTLSLR